MRVSPLLLPSSSALPARGLAVVTLVVLTLLSAALVAAPALAQQLPRLEGTVTDEAGVLEDGEPERVASELRRVAAQENIQLHVLYTDTTGGRSVTAFTDAVAAENSLGGDDALLAVALDDRVYGMWVSDALTGITDSDINEVLTGEVQSLLAGGEFGNAAVAAAQGLVRVSDEAQTPPAGTPAPAPGVSPGLMLLLLLALAWVASLINRRIRRRRGVKRAAEERDRRTGKLAREANAMLLATDEAIREAEHELGFAEAEFRGPDLERFREALQQSREELHAAFAVRQQLDEQPPDRRDEREGMLRRIIEHTQRVDALLGAERARLDELRDLARQAPATLDALPGRLEDTERRVRRAQPLLEELQARGPRSARSVEGNLVEAGKRIAAGRDSTARGRRSAEAGETTEAANLARDAQEAMAQAVELVQAVEHLAAAIDDADHRLAAELEEAGAEVAAARDALAGGRAEGFEARLREAQSLLQRASSEAAAGDRDALEAYRLAAKARAAAGEVLGGIREAEEERGRHRAAASAAVRSAEVIHMQASDYIAPRRRGIGREARTRLQESERHLGRAQDLLESEPLQAAEEAKTAERLAEEAYWAARRDFEEYDSLGGPFGRGPFGGGWDGPGGGVIVIGGFPIPLGGSGRGGGGWGGSMWGSPGGGRSRGGLFGGGGRSAGGAFGGGRSRGGGFGGGRSAGGRF